MWCCCAPCGSIERNISAKSDADVSARASAQIHMPDGASYIAVEARVLQAAVAHMVKKQRTMACTLSKDSTARPHHGGAVREQTRRNAPLHRVGEHHDPDLGHVLHRVAKTLPAQAGILHAAVGHV